MAAHGQRRRTSSSSSSSPPPPLPSSRQTSSIQRKEVQSATLHNRIVSYSSNNGQRSSPFSPSSFSSSRQAPFITFGQVPSQVTQGVPFTFNVHASVTENTNPRRGNLLPMRIQGTMSFEAGPIHRPGTYELVLTIGNSGNSLKIGSGRYETITVIFLFWLLIVIYMFGSFFFLAYESDKLLNSYISSTALNFIMSSTDQTSSASNSTASVEWTNKPTTVVQGDRFTVKLEIQANGNQFFSQNRQVNVSMISRLTDDDSQGQKDLYYNAHTILGSEPIEFKITEPIDQAGEHTVNITVQAPEAVSQRTMYC
ncbi:hypothetical protein T310_3885 [Rasamsonia emersonii CBS 393.64]|uniref:Uncharacterized protein n=1 Tax=Rasamsonia emersonii (strain ATCC 16479 / CBS 393.64 / IMI 116815) TaxID=1408163 RepID=A0A0F4YUW6_RASE3|nr:hypothetical protein T310_3885 [Rasamsonia emersonii CBS 393.64]KKA22082.1 hypothetical protein T310_3885 [Rasamsonia emersonii CBS 393.64]